MPIDDPFAQLSTGLDSPATRHFEIAPSDTADLPALTRALYVGAGGAVAVMDAQGTVAVYLQTSDGVILPVRARRVMETGTTAAAIVGLV